MYISLNSAPNAAPNAAPTAVSPEAEPVDGVEPTPRAAAGDEDQPRGADPETAPTAPSRSR